jgi:uroporphyrinogen-III decarboxylase
MTREEINAAKAQKTFVLPRKQALADLAKWPDNVVPTNAQVNEYIPELCRLPYDYIYRDSGRAMAECTLLAWEYTGLDGIEANIDIYNFEVENAGAKLNFFKDHMPDVNRNNFLVKDEKDLDKIKFRGLDAGRCRYLIEYCKAWTAYSGLDIFPGLCAPWSAAVNLCGLENLVVAALSEPDFVHEMMRRIVYDLQVPMYKALIAEIPGCQAIVVADAWASPPMVSVPVIRDFAALWHGRLQEAMGIPVPNIGVWGSSYLKGKDKDEFMEIVTKMLGMTAVFDPDQERDGVTYYREFANKAGVPFLTGFSTAALLAGPIDSIVERAKKYTLEGNAGKTPYMFLFSNIAPRTPIDHIRTAIAVAKTYGAPGSTEHTPFKLPPSAEGFSEFLKKKIKNNPEGYTFAWLEKSGWAKEVKG